MKFYRSTYQVRDAETDKVIGWAESDKGALAIISGAPHRVLLYWDGNEERDEWVSEQFGRPVYLKMTEQVEYEPRKIIPLVFDDED